LPNPGHKTDIELPPWLKTATSYEPGAAKKNSLLVTRYSLLRKNRERFLDKTLRHTISFLKDSMFNETVSIRNGLLQMIEPRLKIITLLILIIVLSFQKSPEGILLFLSLGILSAAASKIPLSSFINRLLPAFILTALISVPATLNLIVDGEPIFVLHRFEGQMNLGPFNMPEEITITKQGVNSALTLCMRVAASVSFVFLMTMTTQPNRFMKSLTSLMPGVFRTLISISYRYIFFLIRKIELFIMGFRSRNISAVRSSQGRRWIASRIGLLFAISMELSRELGMAMESRGYKETGVRRQESGVRIKDFSKMDIAWFISVMLFAGVMLWKSIN
jgi:cobalt/nickel transport system permease protein